MGQTVDGGLQYLNVNSDIYKQGQDIGTGSDFAVDKNRYGEQSPAVSEEFLTGYKYERGNSGVANSTMDNFEEYLKNKQEKAKEAGQDARSEERQAKEDAKEISRSLSSEEIQKLQMMGIDVTSAKLSDIMGMVNTMRGQAHRDELAKMLAGISAGNGDMEGLTLVGGTAKVAGTDVEVDSVQVSDVILAENKAHESSKKDNTLENLDSKSVNFQMSDKELVYIIKNGLNLNKENMYKAHFSGSVSSKETIPEDVLNQMMPQIEKVIEQAGLEGDKVALDGAKFLMNNNLPVTTDNIKAYVEYQQYEGKDVSEVSFQESEAVTKKAEQLVKDVATFNPEMLYDMVKADKQITIAAMVAFSKESQGKVSKEAKEFSDNFKLYNQADGAQEEGAQVEMSDKDLKAVTAMRQMEELRLSMTMDAATKLVKSDFNIDTRELSKVVSKLKNMEELLIKNQLKQANVEPTKENMDLYNEVSSKISGLADGHAKIIASPLKGLDFSVNTLYSEKLSVAELELKTDYETVKRDAKYSSFEAATRSYEAVGTAPRADMGDSISKAFANVADILQEMNLPVNYENERAVRILGYNSMEITPENIAQVVDYDRQVNQLMDTFYPEAVLSMIKDGINPLDVPIDELNATIRNRNYNEGVTEAENFATYLRDMEKQGLVSPEERESYIGIYRAMNKLAKSGDREAGWVFNSGASLTVRNLISAMRSRKASGIDVSVDENFGMLESATTLSKDMEKQINSAFQTDMERQEADVQEYMSRVASASEEIWNFLAENNIEATGVNVMAVENMLSSQGGIYQLVSDILSKMKFKTNAKDELIDEETENMSDAMTGEDVGIPFSPESILESFRGSEEMSLKYEDLRDKLTELMYSAGVEGTITSLDISAIKTVSAGFTVMSSMAKNDRYQLPVETESGIKVVNLTIARDEANRGTIDISMDGGDMGSLTAKIRTDGNGRLMGYIVSSTSEGNYMLQDHKQYLEKTLEAGGFDGAGITLGSVSGETGTISAYENATKSLYEASICLVKAISGFVAGSR